jgi:DNA (cytosine-5)-methyltransferase 1
MTYATTFSGIGGWELGLNACGWDLQWQCERDKWCQTLLKERFGVPVYDDITTICQHNPPPVDALIGSPPCQPFSTSGKRRGTGDERHLYPSFIKLVRHLQPRWVLMENVAGLLFLERGKPFGQYIGGLAALGYCITWHCIPGRAINASHIRDRVWFIAYAPSAGQERLQSADSKSDAAIRGGLQEAERSNTIERPELLSKVLPSLRSSWYEEVEPVFLRKPHGVSHWAHRIHALGNSVIPQIPFLIGQAINQIEQGQSE